MGKVNQFSMCIDDDAMAHLAEIAKKYESTRIRQVAVAKILLYQRLLLYKGWEIYDLAMTKRLVTICALNEKGLEKIDSLLGDLAFEVPAVDDSVNAHKKKFSKK